MISKDTYRRLGILALSWARFMDSLNDFHKKEGEKAHVVSRFEEYSIALQDFLSSMDVPVPELKMFEVYRLEFPLKSVFVSTTDPERARAIAGLENAEGVLECTFNCDLPLFQEGIVAIWNDAELC